LGLLVWANGRGGRVNTAEEVTRHLGIPVVGLLPLISWWRRITDPRLEEAVEGIAARLWQQKVEGQSQVVLVTSPSGQEGVSELAKRLAASLARKGYRTLLADFNFRHPKVHRAEREYRLLAGEHGAPVKRIPGVCEWLREEASLDNEDVIRTVEGLPSVLAAGKWDAAARVEFTRGRGAELLDELRNRFDFVVVDASPTLPVADTRYVASAADRVLLSVFRDRSRLPEVHAAREAMEAAGVQTLEVVFVGPSERLRNRNRRYEQ
jgi:Mrp family chromosome partitioning ATPase